MSRSAEPARAGTRGRTIAWPIFALVLASVLVATAVFIAVTFSGPPPMQRPYALPWIARALQDGSQPIDPEHALVPSPSDFDPPRPDRSGPPPPDPLRTDVEDRPILTLRASLPVRTNERDDPARRARLASLLGVPAGTIVARTASDRGGAGDFVFDSFTFAVRSGTGWRVVQSPVRPFLTRWHWMTMAAMLAAILALALPAFALARAISRPLRRVAQAAEQAQAGAALPPLPEGGSCEVRELSHAVAAMHARLAGHAAGRTAMLAAIAHDLGTPLSRLAFWIEQLPDQARTRASADIDEMRAMIAATLVFARDEAGEQTATRVDLGSLLDSLVEDMAVAGVAVTIEPGPRAVVRGDSGALRRVFANLVENAVRYGDRARVGWRVADGAVTVDIADDGPGIDLTQAERLFEPFVRGERSRNRATGGTGLGLAIVRSIATRHGGSAWLENGATGARACVRLPLSP